MVARYHDFTTFGALLGDVVAMNLASLVVMLSLLLGEAPTGFCIMASQVLAVPMQLARHLLRQVIYPQLRENLAHDRAGRTVWRVTSGLALLAVSAVLAFTAHGWPLFLIVLGDAWAAAGTYIGIIVLWLVTAFVNIPSVVMCGRRF